MIRRWRRRRGFQQVISDDKDVVDAAGLEFLEKSMDTKYGKNSERSVETAPAETNGVHLHHGTYDSVHNSNDTNYQETNDSVRKRNDIQYQVTNDILRNGDTQTKKPDNAQIKLRPTDFREMYISSYFNADCSECKFDSRRRQAVCEVSPQERSGLVQLLGEYRVMIRLQNLHRLVLLY